MTFPFSREEFLSVFAEYNESVWPAQLALYSVALVATALAFRRSKKSECVLYAVLAFLWLWMALVYHATFFSRISPLAVGFAGAFLVQALLFARLTLHVGTNPVVPKKGASGWGGAFLVVVALLFYPLFSIAAGHYYPAQPTFGLPCPTTIFTLGLLLWKNDTAPKHIWVIPVLWAITGTVGAVNLGIAEDASLALAIGVCAVVWTRRIQLRKSGKIVQRIGDPLIVGQRS